MREVFVKDAKTGLPTSVFFKSYSEGILITFVCHYSSTIEVSSDIFKVKTADAQTSMSNYGSLEGGFSIGK